ncbi:MAG: cell division protein FtsA [Candidatus Paceibacterota bacterium]
MSRDLSVGIDIGSHHVKVMAVGGNGPERLPHIHAAGYSPSDGMREGYAVNTESITKAVEQAIDKTSKSLQRDIDRAHISIGGASLQSVRSASSLVFDTDDHKITEDDIQHVITAAEDKLSQKQLKNYLVLHRFPLAYKIDGRTTLGNPEGMHGKKLSVQTLFITVLSQHAYDLVEVVEDAGVDVDDIVAGPLAAAEVTLTDAQKIAGCVLVNIGSETVSVIVWDNNLPISLVVFPIGSNDITNDIALGLKIPLEKAEQIKLGGVTGGSIPEKKLDEITSARLEDIFELIGDHLERINRQGLLPAGIVMTGGGSGLPMISDVARDTLDLPSSVSKLKLPKTKTIQSLENMSWSTVYGTATWARRKGQLGVLGNLNSSKNTITNWIKQFLP